MSALTRPEQGAGPGQMGARATQEGALAAEHQQQPPGQHGQDEPCE
ncbi:MAG TPA: hypothetical protein VG013_16780 [Gemmataceae bacterium]|nr:hypothetical protein [Gemmataceae bacterium]